MASGFIGNKRYNLICIGVNTAYGETERVRELLKAPGIDINMQNRCGYRISNNVRVRFAALTVH